MLLAMEMGNPFLPLFIASQNEMAAQSAALLNALALALPMLASMLMGPIWGKMADRIGYKSMLMRAAWALTLTQGLMACASSVGAILVIRVLQGAFAGFITAMQTYVISICDWNEKSCHLSSLQSSKAIATSCAGASGGFLLSFIHFRGLFLLTSLLCLVTTVIMHACLPAQEPRKITARSHDYPTQFSHFVIAFIALITMTQMAKFLPDPGFSLYMMRVLHGQPWVIGLMYSLPAIGTLLSTKWCGQHFDQCRRGKARINHYFFYYLTLAMVLMFAHGFVQQPLLLAVIRLLWGIVLAALLPALFTLVSDCSEEQGHALGIANSFAKLGNLSGLLLGGWVSGLMPLHYVFLIIAAVYFLMFIIVLSLKTLNDAAFLKTDVPTSSYK
ncbi:multidrug resistance efflux pump [Legionella lansingensis]|uniref:Multidrug resistance efflux pump n=2 Tax=Legionella lansingensis TaxID=45067 RepID=A0A0W0VSQ6_9GAMM|nr:multidrug resistance efflux pump [Legionella lansingensis]